jgi:organic hydroperoxide reductase OsmC/OhrA
MEGTYTFRTSIWWTKKLGGLAEAEGVPEPIEFSAPPEFNGTRGLWSPEHLLLSAVGSCYTATFAAIAEYSKFPFTGFEVKVQGTVTKGEGGFRFSQVVLRPTLTLASSDLSERGSRMLEKAHRACIVTHSLACGVALEPIITVLEPQLEPSM